MSNPISLMLDRLPKFVKLVKTQYNGLESRDEHTFYYLTDTNELMLGNSALTTIYHQTLVNPVGNGIYGHIYHNIINNAIFVYTGEQFVPINAAVSASMQFVPTVQYAELRDVILSSATLANVRWSDPPLYTEPWGTIRAWGKTVLVANEDHVPQSHDDGTVICVNDVRNAYYETPCEVPMPNETIHIALFTQTGDGTWSDAANSPHQTIVGLTIESLADFMYELRRGNINGLRSVYPVGSTLPYIQHTTFTTMSWMVGQYDYTGHYSTVGQYCGDTSIEHNVILVPTICPSLASGAQLHTPYDPIEKTSALSIDTEFITGKTYYTTSGCTTEYTDTPGPTDTPASLKLYEKGRATSNGYGRYLESFVRRWLNSDTANWYSPINIFENTSETWANNNPGFLMGFNNEIRQAIHPVNNKYLVHNDTYDVVSDMVWLLPAPMMFTDNELGYNSPRGGVPMLELYRNMTQTERIVYSYNHTACYTYTGSQERNNANTAIVVNLSTSGARSTSGKLGGGSQGKDTTLPCICLA